MTLRFQINVKQMNNINIIQYDFSKNCLDLYSTSLSFNTSFFSEGGFINFCYIVHAYFFIIYFPILFFLMMFALFYHLLL